MYRKQIYYLLLLIIMVMAVITVRYLLLYPSNQDTLKKAVPTPSYIKEIFPAPSSTLTVTEFQGATDAVYALEKSSICIQIWGKDLLEIGDELTITEVLGRFSLSVNENKYQSQPSIYIADSSKQEGTIDPNTNKPLFYIPPGFPVLMCYKVALNLGKHDINITYHTTSRRLLEYTWSFYLVKN